MSERRTPVSTWWGLVKLVVLLLILGAAIGAWALWTVVREQGQGALSPVVQSAPAPGGGTKHLAIDGRPVIVKAVVEPRPGRLLTWTIDFGDGSDPAKGTVSSLNLSARHLFPASQVGRYYEATVTVTDSASGEQSLAVYPIEFVDPTLDNKIAVSLDDALWRLHTTQIREEHPIHGPLGHWNDDYHSLGSTAMVALAFQVNGFDGRPDRRDTPYGETVDRALAWLLTHLLRVDPPEGAPPDPNHLSADGNGFALTVPGERVNYELPLVVMALVASQAPERQARVALEDLHGRTHKAIVLDLLETLWNGQAKSGYTGGWRYLPGSTDSDMSVTQWPVLAMWSAREVFGVRTPDEVKEALRDGFLVQSQVPDGGGFTYQPGGDHNMRLTGAGLIGLAFAGVEPTDERVTRATAYIDEHWDQGNIGDTYAMYAVMKGAKLTGDGIETFGEHDWLTEYGEHFYTTQDETGGWPEDHYGKGALATAWPALVISKDVFASAQPVEVEPWKRIATLLGGILGALIALLLVVRVGFALFAGPGRAPPAREPEAQPDPQPPAAPEAKPAPAPPSADDPHVHLTPPPPIDPQEQGPQDA
jgi:hypothetical protein